MGEWKEHELGDITDWFSGGTPSKSVPSYWEGEIPWVSAKTMTDYKVRSSNMVISEEGLQNGSRLAQTNDILLLVRGSGLFNDIPINLVEEPVAFNQDIKAIRAKNKLYQKFLYYWLFGHKKELYDILEETGIGAGKFDTDILKKLRISIPEDEDELKAVVGFAESIFDKIDLLKRQNKTLNQLAQTLFRQWFVDGEKVHWDWKQLGEFIEVVRGLSYKGGGLSDPENGIPMHNLNSVFEGGGYKYEGIKYYSGEYRNHHIVNPGDLIITNTEQGHDLLLIGFPAIVPKYFGENGIFSQHIYKLLMKDDFLTAPFLYYLLMTFDIREQIAGSTNGSTVNMLPKDGIEWARFRVPTKAKIDEFTALVQPMLDKQETNFESIKNLEALRKTLLPKLMSGEVPIS